MAIVSSSFVVGHAQEDGRSYVVETHTDHLGTAHRVEYGPVPVIDYDAVMTARASQIARQLADEEFDRIVSNGA